MGEAELRQRADRKNSQATSSTSTNRPKTQQKESTSHNELCCDVVLFLAMCFHVFSCPFTKVEESFNVQAMHDLLFLNPKTEISLFDHLEFSGVVPRTFLGPLFVIVCASPILMPLRLFFSFLPKLVYLYVCRVTLGILGLCAFSALRRAVRRVSKFPNFSTILTAITISQFHYLFYISRPLANTFAMSTTTLACACLLNAHIRQFVWLLTFTAVVFRCDSILLSFPLLLWYIFFSPERSQWLSRFLLVFSTGIQATIVCVALTFCVDSYFWQTLLWPEGVVFKFNVIENRSSEWGTSPWHWYFSSALPRALLGSIFFIPFAFTWRSNAFLKGILISSLLYVVLYSKLPHKELRFLFPVLPLLNVAAALGFSQIWSQRQQDALRRLITYSAVLGIVASLIFALGFLYVSSLNYPGGEALQTFHSMYSNTSSNATLHIDNLAAISGVSRFSQERNSLQYVKTEHLQLPDYQKLAFNYLINSAEEIAGFVRVKSVGGLVRVVAWPPKIVVENVLHIFEAM